MPQTRTVPFKLARPRLGPHILDDEDDFFDDDDALPFDDDEDDDFNIINPNWQEVGDFDEDDFEDDYDDED
jgi:hypothetical protein